MGPFRSGQALLQSTGGPPHLLHHYLGQHVAAISLIQGPDEIACLASAFVGLLLCSSSH
jgi:hypothetical protein